jgi:hypothetical protein
MTLYRNLGLSRDLLSLISSLGKTNRLSKTIRLGQIKNYEIYNEQEQNLIRPKYANWTLADRC